MGRGNHRLCGGLPTYALVKSCEQSELKINLLIKKKILQLEISRPFTGSGAWDAGEKHSICLKTPSGNRSFQGLFKPLDLSGVFDAHTGRAVSL